MPIKAKYNGSYKDITDLMNVDESIDYVLAKTSSSYKRVYTATRSIEDAPPTTFKSIKSGANLTDYRIYGQTVDGESAGDRTGNLFDGEVEVGSWNINTQPCSKIVTNTRMRNANFIKVDENSTYSITMSAKENVSLLIHFLDAQCNYISETTWLNNISNFNTPSQCEYINIIFKKGNNEAIALSDISNIMLNAGSTPLPYEPYGYKVPVTVEGKNLFDAEIVQGSISNSTGAPTTVPDRVRSNENAFIFLNSGTYTINASGVRDVVVFCYSSNDVSTFVKSATEVSWRNLPYRFTANADYYYLFAFRKGGNATVTPSDISNIMLNTGSTALPYEPYQPPVTTPIYLPEQIRKVGDEAEYIDYGEQKFVKKFYKITLNFDDMNNDESFPGWFGGTAVVEYCNKIRSLAINTPDGYMPVQYSSISNFKAIVNVRNNRSILFLGASFDIGHTQSELKEIYAGRSITFILKIPDTELDVTLPALPTLPGTNVLSVGTEVQPSKIDITGHIKNIPEVTS